VPPEAWATIGNGAFLMEKESPDFGRGFLLPNDICNIGEPVIISITGSVIFGFLS
jgi:hypothetical protein